VSAGTVPGTPGGCNHPDHGPVVPVVGQTYSLAEVPDAMRDLEAGEALGKIAITV